MSGGALKTIANPIDAGVSKGFQALGAPQGASDFAAGGPYFAQLGSALGGKGGSTNLGPNVLPNLGANTLTPLSPGGAFMRQHGGGLYNNMAFGGAGMLFNPAAQANGAKGGTPIYSPLMKHMPPNFNRSKL